MANSNGKTESEIAGLDGEPFMARRRGIVAYPLMVPPILPDGRIPRYRRVGRFNALPVAGAVPVGGTRIVIGSDARVALILKNVGAGDVFFSDLQEVSNADMPIGPGEALSFLYPTTPMNALYAVGVAGADLRVGEIIFANPEEWLADVESGEVGA